MDNLQDSPIVWSFEQLRGETYVVRPKGALGTGGWINGKPWAVEYIKGLHKAARRVAHLNSSKDSK